MKLWRSFILILGIIVISMVTTMIRADDDWDDDSGIRELLVRAPRGAKDRSGSGGSASSCKYTKGEWSECDSKTNKRSRTLKLKKGDKNNCDPTKVIQKKCKKPCRYEKGTFSPCQNSTMVRVDNIKPNSDPTCQATRRITKKCKQETSAVNSKKNTKAERNNKKKDGKQ